jgi:hypothetical protein
MSNENYDAYSTFECQLPTPILGACKTQILRATIPNAMVNIPDYALTFGISNWLLLLLQGQ